MFDVFVMDLIVESPNDFIGAMQIPANAVHTRYFGTHLDTINRCVERAKTEYIWVLANNCDYHQFDFDWKPSPWESKQIHCWASDAQQQGDTFLIPVDEFKKQMPLERLEYFQDVHYHYPGVYRFSVPSKKYERNLPSYANNPSMEHPYTIFSYGDDVYPDVAPSPSLWKERAIYPLSKSGECVLIPRECKGQISTQLYDYPYISREFDEFIYDNPLDVVFIENGEKNANKNYKHLLRCLYPNDAALYPARNHRVSGVNGRSAAYKAAAESSRTAWFFAVFAKCEVNPDFDWDWQPDYMQGDKHYIFHAKNPVNGLEYGHMAVIAYNKHLVLESKDTGLDFTLSAEHAVVPELSCTARFNVDPVVTWRTAFREAIKLKQTVDIDYSVEAEYRLHKWLHYAEGDFAEWSLRGASDAVRYYHDVNGNQKELMKSFEWEWLDKFMREKYKTL